jgi:hypothetical protein
MRLEDQFAVLEWLPVETHTVRRYKPRGNTRMQRNFETVAAAVRYATTYVPEDFRETAKITTDAGSTLHWADIERMSRARN